MWRWKDLSISKKIFAVFGVMALLIMSEWVVLRLSLKSLSAVRAFIAGESQWSKAEKEAISNLQTYRITLDEKYFERFLQLFSVPEGDAQARIELSKINPDLSIIRKGFLSGKIHPSDIDPMIDFLRRFYWVNYVDQAIQAWTKGDALMIKLKKLGYSYRGLISKNQVNSMEAKMLSEELENLSDEISKVEQDYSNALGDGSRWLEGVVISTLFFLIFIVEGIGIALTFLTSRSITQRLNKINVAASRIASGDLSAHLEVQSKDEVGFLMESVNQMGKALRQSYDELEQRVSERTAKLTLLAEENNTLYEEAKSAVYARDEFISIASHELKTPLFSLTLQLQLLLHTLKKQESEILVAKKLETLAQTALQQAQRQATLIEKLMDLARARTGKLQLSAEPCDLVTLVRESIAQFQTPTYPEVILHAPDSLQGNFDTIRLSQVITNLVSNAIKHGGKTSVHVHLKSQNQRLTIRVEDSGPGISPEDQSRIFDRFQQGQTEERKSGLGLGLYITRQIVEAHGGLISVKSSLGNGAQFNIEIPHHPSFNEKAT